MMTRVYTIKSLLAFIYYYIIVASPIQGNVMEWLLLKLSVGWARGFLGLSRWLLGLNAQRINNFVDVEDLEPEVNIREVFKGALPRKNNENTLSDRFTARQKNIC